MTFLLAVEDGEMIAMGTPAGSTGVGSGRAAVPDGSGFMLRAIVGRCSEQPLRCGQRSDFGLK